MELTPEELEEIRKREERKDRLHQNYLKRKASGAQKQYEDKIDVYKRQAVGGFTGATLAATMRWGLARGVFSNDAGLGLSASVQAQVPAIDHPAQQGMWAVIETFMDTIVVCSLTGFVVLFSGVWHMGGDGSTFAATAMEGVFGTAGKIGCILCLALFGLSSLITNTEGCTIQAISLFNSKIVARIFQFFLGFFTKA